MDGTTAPTQTPDTDIYWMLTNGNIPNRCNKCGCNKMFGCTSENGVVTYCATDAYKTA